jgi:four helix bundle protein
MSFTFEKLIVYRKAVAFADGICTLTKGFSRGYFFLGDQLNRAALSITANIVEGNGSFTKPDQKDFFGIARGRVQACIPLLDIAFRQSLIQGGRHEIIKHDLEATARMLSGLINGLNKRNDWSVKRRWSGCDSGARG